MTKKDYQAIAGAMFKAKPKPALASTVPYGLAVANEDDAVYDRAELEVWEGCVSALADVLAADSPRFDRETFIAACEDGNVNRRPKRKASPLAR